MRTAYQILKMFSLFPPNPFNILIEAVLSIYSYTNLIFIKKFSVKFFANLLVSRTTES